VIRENVKAWPRWAISPPDRGGVTGFVFEVDTPPWIPRAGLCTPKAVSATFASSKLHHFLPVGDASASHMFKYRIYISAKQSAIRSSQE